MITGLPGHQSRHDHRSQIATLLSQQDIELPALDGWVYNDAMHERP